MCTHPPTHNTCTHVPTDIPHNHRQLHTHTTYMSVHTPHMCTHMYVCTLSNVGTQVHTLTCMRTHSQTCALMCMHTLIHVHTQTCTHAHSLTGAHMHVHYHHRPRVAGLAPFAPAAWRMLSRGRLDARGMKVEEQLGMCSDTVSSFQESRVSVHRCTRAQQRKQLPVGG